MPRKTLCLFKARQLVCSLGSNQYRKLLGVAWFCFMTTTKFGRSGSGGSSFSGQRGGGGRRHQTMVSVGASREKYKCIGKMHVKPRAAEVQGANVEPVDIAAQTAQSVPDS